MMIDKITALLDGLDSMELDRLPPARRQKFSELCYHWHKLAERRQEPEQPRSGVLSDLRRGQRQE
jgi:hypothetical protein